MMLLLPLLLTHHRLPLLLAAMWQRGRGRGRGRRKATTGRRLSEGRAVAAGHGPRARGGAAALAAAERAKVATVLALHWPPPRSPPLRPRPRPRPRPRTCEPMGRGDGIVSCVRKECPTCLYFGSALAHKSTPYTRYTSPLSSLSHPSLLLHPHCPRARVGVLLELEVVERHAKVPQDGVADVLEL